MKEAAAALNGLGHAVKVVEILEPISVFSDYSRHSRHAWDEEGKGRWKRDLTLM